MYENGVNKYILSSGGQTPEVAGGGMAIYMRDHGLTVEVRIRNTAQHYIATRPHYPTSGWIFLTVMWKTAGMKVCNFLWCCFWPKPFSSM